MINRSLLAQIEEALAYEPAVALLGPRQVGKTTLAIEISRRRTAVYLDLESDADQAKLQSPESYFADQAGRLVVIDEIHRAPGLFPVLRGQIDRQRRDGHENGLYLLLGSASLDLLHQAGETLAGRIAYLELAPLNIFEIDHAQMDTLWLRGGMPKSFLAPSDNRSLLWRKDFIRSYLEYDIPQFGRRIAAETLRRFWTMLAHHQGGVLNLAQLARNLGIDPKTATAYLDLLCDLLLVRRLPPWHANVGKRLVRSPKVFIRDSGLVHALLAIANKDALLSHPVIGQSWEGFVIENLLANLPHGVDGWFYRTNRGAEIDLVLSFPDGALWAVEIKHSLTPKLERGFYHACEDLNPARKYVVYSGRETYRMAEDIVVISLNTLADLLRKAGA